MNDDASSDSLKNAALTIALATSFLVIFMGSAINIALPSIGKEFAADSVTLGWVTTSYMLATAVFQVPFGRLADIYGRKRILVYGIIFYTITSFIAVFSTSTTMLIGFRVLQGIASAMIFGAPTAILVTVYPPHERGKALGIMTIAIYLGISLGPLLGGLLIKYLGWQSIFWLNVPVGVVVLAVTLWKLKGEWIEARGERFDITGSLIFGPTVITIIYGLTILPSLVGVWLILAGIIGMLAFIRWETRVESPVVNTRLFQRNRHFTCAALAELSNYAATSASPFLLSLYLQYIKGFTAELAGLIWLAMPATQAIFSPVAGRLSDKLEPRILSTIGMAFTTTGLLLLSFLSQDKSVSYILVSLIALGFGIGLYVTPNLNAAMSSVDKKYYGVSSGVLSTIRSTGAMISMAVTMLIFSLYIGPVEITPEHYPAFMKSSEVAFIILAALSFTGVVVSMVRGKLRPDKPQQPL